MRLARLAALVLAVWPQPLQAQSSVKRIDQLVHAYHEQGRFNGAILVAVHGKVIYRNAFGWANVEWHIPNRTDTRFRIGSATKQFTAMLILQLYQEGKLRLDGTIREYLPEYPREQGDRVTIHQLLTHTSGIPSYEGLPTFFRDLSRDPARPLDFLAVFDSLPLEFEPGSQFRYNNSGYFILGAIIERLTGLPYDVALRQRVLDPLGLKDTGYDWSDRLLERRASGYVQGLDGLTPATYIDMSLPFSAGALYSTVEDLWRWDQALDQGKLLSPASYARYQLPQVETGIPQLGRYAYGWGVRQVPRGPGRDSATAIAHGGSINGFGAMNFRIPADGIAIIWLDNSSQHPPLHEQIAQILYGQPVEPPLPSVARTIYPVLRDRGVAAAVREYRALRAKNPDRFEFAESELNDLGYTLLRQRRAADAVEIFALNVEMYPNHSNPYDSLAEACLAVGDTARAVVNYRRSLELDPSNSNARQVLDRVGAK